ncbi:MAG: CpaF family protein [Firmicutes bacterium]|nr:CpaF family protein [Bacillota bacterium]
MSLRSRVNNMAQDASQAFKSMKSLATRAGGVEPDYLTARFTEIQFQVQNILLSEINNPEQMDRGELRSRVIRAIDQIGSVTSLERDMLVQSMVDEISGFGPIQRLMDDTDVSEIMINGPDEIYVERHGQLMKTGLRFRDESHLRQIVSKMLAFSGRRIDESSPMVDARLLDGSRLNAVLRPVSIGGDAVTIRKFSRDMFFLSQLISLGTLSEPMAQFLEAAVQGRLNIIVSGGTGSGKTTTLNALSAYIPASERIVSIEDAAELQLQQSHRVGLEARPANIEGQGQVSIRDLVRNALRMRPDRILVGEVRGSEALDMLQAMNTGHEGSLTTIHANSPRDCLSRVETMVLMSGNEIPLLAIRSQIASALDIIVQQARLMDGSRRIVKITEIVGIESGVITTQDLFEFQQTGLDEDGKVVGTFRANGIVPMHLERLHSYGIALPATVFGGNG